MSLTGADLAQHIVTLRRLYARVLEADIELLRRAHGESIVEEALHLADEAARQASQASQELPPKSDEHASAIAEALNRLMDGRSPMTSGPSLLLQKRGAANRGEYRQAAGIIAGAARHNGGATRPSFENATVTKVAALIM